MRTSSRLPIAKQAVPTIPRKQPITTPQPNLLSGYQVTAFSEELRYRALQELANHKGLLYPFLNINFVRERGTIWSAINQCISALATLTNLVKKLKAQSPGNSLIDSTT